MKEAMCPQIGHYIDCAIQRKKERKQTYLIKNLLYTYRYSISTYIYVFIFQNLILF